MSDIDYMVTNLLGLKLGQTQEFSPEGKRIPVTLIQTGPCFITAVSEIPGKNMYQLGFKITKNISKSQEGHLKKAGLTQKLRFLHEFKVGAIDESMKPGTEITASQVFKPGDPVQVTGISKGKGFAGVVKRHGFKGGPRTHGQSDRERAPGSIGQTTTPGRVYRGKRMAGRMGTDTVTVRGLMIAGIDDKNQIIRIKGLLPGSKNGLLIISKGK